MDLNDHVYTGFWVNEAYGSTYGATLTLSRRSGGFLIAFIAVYVGLVGRSVWKLARYGLHLGFSSRLRPDGIYHQRQVLLRNARTAPDALEDVFDLLFAWRNRSKGSFRRLSPVVLTAAFVASGFAVASIFSSRVTANDSNEVLLLGKGCGWNESIGISTVRSAMQDLQLRTNSYLGQALACYRGGFPGQPQQCQTYAKDTLSYSLDANATCPFEERVCQNSTGNLLLDSGPLDSFTDLGINSQPRFKLRVNRHCAPLNTRSYSTLYTERQGNESITYMRYNYGNLSISQGDTANDYMYKVRVDNMQKTFTSRSMAEAGFANYDLMAMTAGKTGTFSFIPILELNRSDAEVALIFLDSSGILYMNKTEDPWFSATTPVDLPDYYQSDEPAGVLGCTRQALLCHPERQSDCFNPSLGRATIMEQLAALWPDANDAAAVVGFVMSIEDMFPGPELFHMLQGIPSLLSRFTLTTSFQTDTLPYDRWKQEMEYSFQAYLASLQSGLVEASTEGAFGYGKNADLCPDLAACRKLCYHQKIRSGEFYSFSVLGLSIIIFVGLFLMLIAANIESITKLTYRLQTRFGNDARETQYAMLEWRHNSAFHLQRFAHEALGLGTWRTAQVIPVTKPGEQLGVLDISDPKHTRLQAPDALVEEFDDIQSPRRKRDSTETGEPRLTSSRESFDTQYPRYYSPISNAEILPKSHAP